VRSGLHLNSPGVASASISSGQLGYLASPDNPAALLVAPIENGFLIMTRKYNPNGPDSVSAMFAADAESLSAALLNRLAQARLKL
jgi:hypothetical protein